MLISSKMVMEGRSQIETRSEQVRKCLTQSFIHHGCADDLSNVVSKLFCLNMFKVSLEAAIGIFDIRRSSLLVSFWILMVGYGIAGGFVQLSLCIGR